MISLCFHKRIGRGPAFLLWFVWPALLCLATPLWASPDDAVWQDPKTGLSWHKQGCRAFRESFGGPEGLTLFFARSWISLLNNRKAGGYSDWRLPTIAEYRTIFQAGAGQVVYDYRNVKQVPLYTLGYRPPVIGKRRYAWSRDSDQEMVLAFDFALGKAGSYPRDLDITYEFEALAVRVTQGKKGGWQ